MIVQWMLGALAFSALCAVAAFALERALLTMRRPTRLPWALALTIATVWPLWARMGLEPASASAVVTATLPTQVTFGALTAASDAIPSRWIEPLEPVLLALWIAASTLLLAQIVLALRTLRRVRRDARVMRLNDEQVLVDATLGPAVIGLSNPAIVIPAWLLELDEAIRSVVLRHEREHCRAHDSRLVWLAVATTTLLPWNAPIWWMARRLRDAMEIDCDARTLRDGDDRTLYARVLLLIAQQKASARFAPMLSNSTAQLHRRIQVMHATPVRYPRIRAAFATVVAIIAVATACSSRIATNLVSPAPSPASASEAAPVTLPSVAAPADSLADGPARMLPTSKGPAFPAALRAAGATGSVQAQFIVNNDGSVDTSTLKIMRSTDPAFSAAVRAELSSLRFAPARVDGRAVRQLMTQAFQFVAEAPTAALISRPASPSSSAQSGASPAQLPSSAREPYFDFQVEVPAKLRSGRGPEYPKELRDAGVQGMVLAQFVVDSTGAVDMRTLKVLKSDHTLFSDATRSALADMKFAPATVGGRNVSQLLQTPFHFNLNR